MLILLNFGNLTYRLVTHRDVFSTGEEREEEEPWPLLQCLLVLAAATAGAAGESELVSDALSDAAGILGLRWSLDSPAL